ncbi:MAG: hypothetical protein HUJ88_06050 [Fusobacterium necrophorum]|nr:hypothetical protein [Fusobacterium necrophorum]
MIRNERLCELENKKNTLTSGELNELEMLRNAFDRRQEYIVKIYDGTINKDEYAEYLKVCELLQDDGILKLGDKPRGLSLREKWGADEKILSANR